MRAVSKLLIGISSLVLVNVNAEINTLSDLDTIEGVLGTRVPHIENDADLCQVRGFTSAIITPVIKSELTKIEKLKAITAKDPNYPARVANQILGVSECFSIDPVVFSALIGHESFFYNNATSRTGAIGLGQLTSISLKEIAQQLHAPSIPKNERGSKDALDYFNSALKCVKENMNRGVALKHWWNYTTREARVAELKRNTLLNLTYSAMIFKISYSKSVSLLGSVRTAKNIDAIIKKILNFYNGASEAEQKNHYKKTQGFINGFLRVLDETDNACYTKV